MRNIETGFFSGLDSNSPPVMHQHLNAMKLLYMRRNYYNLLLKSAIAAFDTLALLKTLGMCGMDFSSSFRF